VSNPEQSSDKFASLEAFADLSNGSPDLIASRLRDAHPADAARALSRLPRERAANVVEHLDAPAAASLVRQMHPSIGAGIVAEMKPPAASRVLSDLAPDDRVDILEHLAAELREPLIRQLDSGAAADVRKLASYPADSAGGIMTTEAVALNEAMTAERAIDELRRIRQRLEQLTYVYTVDTAGRLTGVLSMRDLIVATPNQPLGEVKRANVVWVPATMDQEEVARVLRRHGYLALPVVDDDRKLLGIVTADDVADVAEEEATEDIQKIGGTEGLHAPYFEVGLGSMLRKRGGWLSVLFVGEMLTATAMGFFEVQIQRAAMVALFVPLIISSGGNSGSQATTIVIRSLALREILLRDWWRICARELTIGLILGAFLGLIGALRVVLWYRFGWHEYSGHPYLMAATVWISLAGVVAFGSAVGSMLPMLMHRLGLDPASASAPFVATLVDVTGLVLYFVVAIAVLRGTVL
jgi:magnesium transporter